MGWTEDFNAWQERAHALRLRAERVAASVRDEARQLSREAGLDPSLLGIHPHNAMCAYRDGRPWPGVDYKKVRRIIWLTSEKQWEATRLVERINRRSFERLMGQYRNAA